jgi:hypothetical protein
MYRKGHYLRILAYKSLIVASGLEETYALHHDTMQKF